MSFRLRKYEKLWLETLESPKTRKKEFYLGSKNAQCCLGWAATTQKCTFHPDDETLSAIPEFNYDKIRLYSDTGTINISKLNQKGRDILLKYMNLLPLYLDLAMLNDGESIKDIKPMPHKEIAKFIRVNPEAVLRK